MSNGIGPIVNPNPTSNATIAVQQAVEVITSFFSLGPNKSLLGWKWEPVFPGLLAHCIQRTTTVKSIPLPELINIQILVKICRHNK
jgi:hypothetical protein